MRKGFLWGNAQIFPQEALSHIWLCNCSILNFLIYEENLIFFFISVGLLLSSLSTLYFLSVGCWPLVVGTRLWLSGVGFGCRLWLSVVVCRVSIVKYWLLVVAIGGSCWFLVVVCYLSGVGWWLSVSTVVAHCFRPSILFFFFLMTAKGQGFIHEANSLITVNAPKFWNPN